MNSHARSFTVFACLFCVVFMPFAATEDAVTVKQIAVTPIPEPMDERVVLVEHFITPTRTTLLSASEDALQFSWWKWSDETNSDWPDDDAKLRLGQLGMPSNTSILFNEEVGDQLNFDQGIAVGQNHSRTEDAITLTGDIEIISDPNDVWSIRIPFSMTPLVNLSSSTVMYIFITEDNAYDVHGRNAQYLIREMKPEVGFSNQAGNTTVSEWILSSEHLLAAGIDLESDPFGWHITFALFGETVGDETNRLLSLHSTPLPSQWSESSIGDFALPIFLLLVSGVLATGAISNSLRREKGMPRLNARWLEGDLPAIHLAFTANEQPVELKSCEVDKPWHIKGGFKKKRLQPNTTHECSLRLRDWHAKDCSVSIGLEVEELGSWTQFIRLTPPGQSEVPSQRSVETPEQRADVGEIE